MTAIPPVLTPREIFTNSLKRCTLRETFIPAFYERFIASSPLVREKFKNTSFNRQNAMLLESLALSAGAANGDAAALAEITERAETHSRKNLDINPELYDLWLENLLLTARDYDPKWDPTVEDAWRTILGLVIRRMTSSY